MAFHKGSSKNIYGMFFVLIVSALIAIAGIYDARTNPDGLMRELNMPYEASECDMYSLVFETRKYHIDYIPEDPEAVIVEPECKRIVFWRSGKQQITVVFTPYDKTKDILKKNIVVNVKSGELKLRESCSLGQRLNVNDCLQKRLGDLAPASFKVFNKSPAVLECDNLNNYLCTGYGYGTLMIECYDEAGNITKTIPFIIEVSKEAHYTGRAPEKFAEDVLRYTNEYRAAHGLKPLKLHPNLTRLAQKRSQEITKFFSHSNEFGTKGIGSLRIYDVYDDIKGHTFFVVGENIGAGSPTARIVVDEWYRSPSHRENILQPDFRFLGVGCTYDAETVTDFDTSETGMMVSDSSGNMFKARSKHYEPHNARLYWVQVFAG